MNRGLLRIGSANLLAALAVAASACGSPSSPTDTAPDVPPTIDVLTGSVAAPVNGVLQSSFNTFVVGLSNGGFTVTLTSAVETLPDGSLLTTVTMGLGVGTVTNGACTVSGNAFTTAQGGSVPQISGASVPAGTYCVLVSDVSNQLGPVSYAVAVAHF